MALGDFDSKQSSLDFGMSLLGDKEERDRRARKKQKKIKNVSYLLGAIGVSDMFLANKAAKKADLFKESLISEKAYELNKQAQAQQFYDDKLKVLLQDNPGIDMESAGVFDKDGSLWNAMEKLMAAEVKGSANIGTATTVEGAKQFSETEYQKFIAETNRRTENAIKTLQAQYLKHKGYIGETEKMIESRYEDMINHGVRDIMSAKNTSSIRKLLGKFNIMNDISPDLELLEDRVAGGVGKVYINKDIVRRYRNKILENTANIKAYNDQLAGMSLNLQEIPLQPPIKSKRQSGDLKTLKQEHSRAYDENRTIFGQIDGEGKYLGTSESEAWASAYGNGNIPANPRIRRLDSVEVDGETPLGNFPDLVSEDPDTIQNFSNFWDTLYEQEQDPSIGNQNKQDFIDAYESRLYSILSSKEVQIIGDDDFDTRIISKPVPTDVDRAEAIRDTILNDVGYDSETSKYFIKKQEKTLKPSNVPPIDNEEQVQGESGNIYAIDTLENVIPRIVEQDVPVAEKINLIESAKEEFSEYSEIIDLFNEQINELEDSELSKALSFASNKKALEQQKEERERRIRIAEENKRIAESLSLENEEENQQQNESLLEKYPWLED
tara:strand:- start:5285 stop:7111 length:1827 start_codon:yes stop_codon:yes gene_type:complete